MKHDNVIFFDGILPNDNVEYELLHRCDGTWRLSRYGRTDGQLWQDVIKDFDQICCSHELDLAIKESRKLMRSRKKTLWVQNYVFPGEEQEIDLKALDEEYMELLYPKEKCEF